MQMQWKMQWKIYTAPSLKETRCNSFFATCRKNRNPVKEIYRSIEEMEMPICTTEEELDKIGRRKDQVRNNRDMEQEK